MWIMKNATECIIILDESGSMEVIQDDVIGGFNRFIEDQKKIEGELAVTLTTFGGNVRTPKFRVNIAEITNLDEETYVPSGFTPLYDAICGTIDRVGKTLAEFNESERPDKVMVCILTDGEENDSKRFTLRDAQDRIDEQSNKYDWKFIYLGVGPDSFQAGDRLGIHANHQYMYANRACAMRLDSGAFSKVNSLFSNLRKD